MQNSPARKTVRFARYCVLLVLLLFIAGLIFANRSAINIDNFRRLMAKVDFSFSQNFVSKEQIELNMGTKNRFGIYKEGFAALSEERLKIFDASGLELSSFGANYDSPVLRTSDRYVLTYSRGGYEINVFNSFALVLNKKFESRIIDARVNDSGYIAVVTADSRYKAVVHIFNSSFDQIYQWNSSEKYVYTAAVSPDNKGFFVCLVGAVTDDISSEIQTFLFDKEGSVSRYSEPDCVPVSAGYLSNSVIGVITDKKAVFIKNDEKLNEYIYPGTLLSFYHDLGNEFAVCFAGDYSDSGRKTKCVVLGVDGLPLIETQSDKPVKAVFANGRCLLALSAGQLTKYSFDGTVTEQQIDTSVTMAYGAKADNILMVSGDFAQYVSFK